jgi:hypothetical protein
MNSHLRRCRFGIPCCATQKPGSHVRPSTFRGGIAQGAQRAPVKYCHGPTMSALCALHLTHS